MQHQELFTKKQIRAVIGEGIEFAHSDQKRVLVYEPVDLEYKGTPMWPVLECFGYTRKDTANSPSVRFINQYRIDVCTLLEGDKVPGTSLMDTTKAYLFEPWWDTLGLIESSGAMMNLCRYHELPCGSRGMPVMNALKVIKEQWEELKAYILALHVSVD